MEGFYWPIIGLATGGALFAVTVIGLTRRRWSGTSLYVALGALMIGLLHMVAPFRGTLDPAYEGYGFGLLQLDGGPAVGLIAGTVYLLSLWSIWLALANARGPHMWAVVALTAFVLVNMGGYLIGGLVGLNPPFHIQLGEYLSIAPLPATLLAVVVFLLPFLVGLPWAIRRTKTAATEAHVR